MLMAKKHPLMQPSPDWEQLIQPILASLKSLNQRVGVLEHQLLTPYPPSAQPAAAKPTSSANRPVTPQSGAKQNQGIINQYGTEAEQAGMPPPIRALFARWLAEHGANEGTARSGWLDLPMDDYLAALQYTKARLDAAWQTRSQKRFFHRCGNPRCPCQTMDEKKSGLTRHAIAVFLERHGANYNTVKSVGWRLIPLEYRRALLFAWDKIYGPEGAAARMRGVRLYQCGDSHCVCAKVLGTEVGVSM